MGQDVFINGEGVGDSSVLLELLLDVINTPDAIAAVREVFIALVLTSFIIDAGTVACWLHLFDVVTSWQSLAGDVVGTLLHRVVVASAIGAVVASSNDTSVFEPSPWSTNLATVAAERIAAASVAAASGV